MDNPIYCDCGAIFLMEYGTHPAGVYVKCQRCGLTVYAKNDDALRVKLSDTFTEREAMRRAESLVAKRPQPEPEPEEPTPPPKPRCDTCLYRGDTITEHGTTCHVIQGNAEGHEVPGDGWCVAHHDAEPWMNHRAITDQEVGDANPTN
jgi:hypothetical protein